MHVMGARDAWVDYVFGNFYHYHRKSYTSILKIKQQQPKNVLFKKCGFPILSQQKSWLRYLNMTKTRMYYNFLAVWSHLHQESTLSDYKHIIIRPLIPPYLYGYSQQTIQPPRTQPIFACHLQRKASEVGASKQTPFHPQNACCAHIERKYRTRGRLFEL